MHEPEIYNHGHKEIKSVAGQMIRKHFNNIQWRTDGCDTLIDIGSGPGDVFMDYIYPLIPEKFHKVICSDISKDMLEFARTYYGSPNKCEYRVLDIETKAGVPNNLKGTIDHLTSIFCLHWVRDIESSVKNMYDLLRSGGGDCLIIFMPRITIFEAYDYMKSSTKWLAYRQEIERYIPPIYYSKNPKDEFRNMLKEAGFSDITMETKTHLCNYESLESFRANMKSVCGMLECIPTPTLQSEFLDDFVEVVMNLASKSENFHEMKYKYCTRCDIIAASAKKT